MRIGRVTLQLSDKWLEHLSSQPETGMGYQICTITLKNGKEYKQAIIDSGLFSMIKDIE